MTPQKLPEKHGHDLHRADLSGCDLKNVRWQKIRLVAADLSSADLYGADLAGAALTGADLRHCKLRMTRLADADLRGAIMSGNRLIQCSLTNASLAGNDLRFTEFIETDLSSADLSGANLAGAVFKRCDLRGCNLTGADLSNTAWEGCLTKGADFSAALLTRARVRDTGFTDARVKGTRFWAVQGLSPEQKDRLRQHGGSLDSPWIAQLKRFRGGLKRPWFLEAGAGLVFLGLALGAYRIVSNPNNWTNEFIGKQSEKAFLSGDYDRAALLCEIWKKRLEKRNDYREIRPHSTLAAIHRRKNQHEQALKIYEALTQKKLGARLLADIYGKIAQTHMELGNREEAQKYSQLVLDTASDSDNDLWSVFEAQMRPIRILRQEGRRLEAINAYHELLPLYKGVPKQKAQIFDNIAQTHMELGNNEEAEKISRFILATFAEIDNPWPLLNARRRLADILRHTNKHREALKAYEDLLPFYRDSPRQTAQILDSIAQTHMELGNLEEAQKSFQAILDRFSSGVNDDWVSLFNARIHMADIFKRQGRLEEAIKIYRDMLPIYESDPDKTAEILLRIAQTHMEFGKLSEAQKGFKSILDRFSSTGADDKGFLFYARLRLADILKRQDKRQEALQAYQDMLPSCGNDPQKTAEVLDSIAQTHLELGNLQEARKGFQYVLDNFPAVKNPWPLMNARRRLADVLRRQGDARQALKAYQDVLPSYKSYPQQTAEILDDMVQAHLDLGNLGQAEKYCRLILSDFANIDDPWPIVNTRRRLADILGRRGKKEESLKAYEDILPSSKDPQQTAYILDNIAQLHLDLGNWQESERYCRLLLEKFSDVQDSSPLTSAKSRLEGIQRRRGAGPGAQPKNRPSSQ